MSPRADNCPGVVRRERQNQRGIDPVSRCALEGRRIMALTAVLVAMILATSAESVGASSAPRIIKRIGRHPSPTGRCVATLTLDEGDRIVLRVSGCRARLSEDVTGIAWLAPDRLVFASRPVYGTPGLFLYVCGEDSARAIVGSHRSDQAYPDGCDDFELVRVERGSNPEIVFRWFAHIDSLGPKGVSEGGVLAKVRADGRDLTGLP
jgi:hypothetical protein